MGRLISDCRSAGLVEHDATLSWLCAPSFASAALVASALDPRAGRLSVPVEGGVPAGQRYREGTLVCETDIRGPEGLVRVTDCLVIDPRGPRGAGSSGELIRRIHVVEGRARVGVRVAVRPGFGVAAGRWVRDGRRTRLPGPGLPLDLDCDMRLYPDGLDLVGVADLEQDGDRILIVRWQEAMGVGSDVRGRITDTAAWWRRWSEGVSGGQEAVLLRGLTYAPTGAVVRAATTSLADPPADARLCWIEDQRAALEAYRRIGAAEEAERLEAWLERAGDGPPVRTLAGDPPPAERGLDHLARPVRTGAPPGDGSGNVPWTPGLLAALAGA